MLWPDDISSRHTFTARTKLATVRDLECLKLFQEHTRRNIRFHCYHNRLLIAIALNVASVLSRRRAVR